MWVGLVRAALLVCTLAACGNVADNKEPSDKVVAPKAASGPLANDTCHLALTSRYVGAEAAPTVRSAINAITGAQPLRWITPGQAITADYSAQRLNIILDERGRIRAMRCG